MKKCLGCSSFLDDSVAVCSNCGSNQFVAPTQEECVYLAQQYQIYPRMEKEKIFTKRKIIKIAVFIIFLIVLGVFFVLVRDNILKELENVFYPDF